MSRATKMGSLDINYRSSHPIHASLTTFQAFMATSKSSPVMPTARPSIGKGKYLKLLGLCRNLQWKPWSSLRPSSPSMILGHTRKHRPQASRGFLDPCPNPAAPSLPLGASSKNLQIARTDVEFGLKSNKCKASREHCEAARQWLPELQVPLLYSGVLHGDAVKTAAQALIAPLQISPAQQQRSWWRGGFWRGGRRRRWLLRPAVCASPCLQAPKEMS